MNRILAVSHGRRTAETIHMFAPEIDATAAALEFNRAEELDTDGVVPITAAAALLAGLPRERWTIVTSCPRKLAEVRLLAAGLPVPSGMVTSEEVVHGKPDPYCFLLGAERLGIPPERCLVFEDAPAGVQAGRAAGMQVIQVGVDIQDFCGLRIAMPGGNGFDLSVDASENPAPSSQG